MLMQLWHFAILLDNKKTPDVMNMKHLRNKGEWSKLLAISDVLSTGYVDVLFPLEPARGQKILGIHVLGGSSEIHFKINESEVEIWSSAIRRKSHTIQRSWLQKERETLYAEISTSHQHGTFASAAGDAILEALGLFEALEMNSRNDIHLVVQDGQTKEPIEYTVIVKSWIGAKPTLFNSSRATNFRFRIIGQVPRRLMIAPPQVGPASVIQKLLEGKVNLVFEDMDERFRNNLLNIHKKLPDFLASSVIAAFTGADRTSKSIVEVAHSRDFLQIGFNKSGKIYELMMQNFLMAVSRGMGTTSTWHDDPLRRMAILKVTHSGCTELLPIEAGSVFSDQILETTKFETPSRNKFHFGNIIEIDEIYFIDLNFQIRFR